MLSSCIHGNLKKVQFINVGSLEISVLKYSALVKIILIECLHLSNQSLVLNDWIIVISISSYLYAHRHSLKI